MTTAPRLRVRTERRRRPLVAGLGLLLVGVVAFVIGVSTTWLTQAVQIATPVARIHVPDTATFDAEDRSYVLVVDRVVSASRPGVAHQQAAGRIGCTVARADGTEEQIDTAAAQRLETSFGTTFGTFDATDGPTSVTCSWRRDAKDGYRITIAPERRAAVLAGLAATGTGIVLGLVGAGLLWIGWRGTAVVEARPPDDHGDRRQI